MATTILIGLTCLGVGIIVGWFWGHNELDWDRATERLEHYQRGFSAGREEVLSQVEKGLDA